MFQRLTFCALFLVGCWAETELGLCSDVVPFADLEVAPYLGRWYEIQRYNIIFEGHQDCTMAIYSDNGDGTVEVHNTARTEGGFFTDIYGSAEVVAPGTLTVTFPGNPPANYTVLATDYVSYSSVWTCNQNGPYRSAYAWVLSREFPMDAASYDLAVQAFVDNGIDTDLFMPTYQGPDCPYYKP